METHKNFPGSAIFAKIILLFLFSQKIITIFLLLVKFEADKGQNDDAILSHQ